MSQRVMIAMALACNPRLLIADEPTTALDVTVQAQILQLLVRLQEERGMALILITHDLAVVAETAQRVVVMYAGQEVETGALPGVFERPHHPYTAALLAALPEHNAGAGRLSTIRGVVPGPFDRPSGCLLAPRCAYAEDLCRREAPALVAIDVIDGKPAADARAAPLQGADGRDSRESGRVRCHFPLNVTAALSDVDAVR
jgi:dipeptide transport system ATP-binding protein